MTEQIIAKYQCERCAAIVESEAKSGILGIKKPGYPNGWREVNKINLCSKCATEYDADYNEM